MSEDSPVAPGTTINYADDVTISSDGLIYFTDACYIAPPWRHATNTYDTLWGSVTNFMEGIGTGRVLVYDPQTQKVRAACAC